MDCFKKAGNEIPFSASKPPMTMRLLAILFLSCVVLSSCYEYEEELSAIAYGSRDYALSSVLLEDWGPHSANHYNMDFTIIGEESLFEERQDARGEVYFTLSEEFDCYIFTEFFSPGRETFREGTFHALGNRDISEVGDDEFVFRRVQFGRSQGERIFGTGGTISIVITGEGVYRMKYDVSLEDGKKLTGTFIGLPEYLDRR